jgi:cytoskeletal protein RodZ
VSFPDRFRRNKQKSVLPEEVKAYYQSENRQKRGLAVGLAFVALVVTVLVAAALFFGGRFAYNQIWGNDEKQDSNTGQEQTSDNNDSDQSESQDSSEEQQPGSQTEEPPTTPQPQPQPAPAPQPAPTTPSLGDEAMPHTGDPGM